MPVKRPELVTGEFYHVYNRGVEKRVIFPTTSHYLRFLSALQFFNTPVPITLREFLQEQKTGVRPLYRRTRRGIVQKEKPLVKIGAFILLPNHYHLLVQQLVDGGLSLFMKKLGAGFATFFNLKHSRVGPLFQGRYKVKLIDSDRYIRHVQAYIALNALDIVMPKWKDKGIRDHLKARKAISEYQWSSFSSYIDTNKFPGIIDPEFIKKFFDDQDDFENFIFSWTVKDAEVIKSVLAG